MGYFSKLSVLVAFFLAGCSGSNNSGGSSLPTGTNACTMDGQKQFVLDAMRDVYFWNDLLPTNVDLAAYPTPEALLEALIAVQPLDSFSFIDLLAADTQFFVAGQFEGFGFSSQFITPDDLRFLRVFAESPAAIAGFARGQQIVLLNGRTIADIQSNEGVDGLFELSTLEFTIRRPDATEFVATLDKDLVTIDPVPQWRIIDLAGGTKAGYLELATFVGTADAQFATVFEAFANAGVTDVILDLRYNGGGRVDTTELLGDYLGGVAHAAEVFSNTRFNDDNAISNRTSFFQLPGDTVNLSRLVVIATERTASASELLTNSMFPYADVTIVGATTLGKPVGQLGLQFCDKILRPTAFETLNAIGEGGYFDGLLADCPVQDNFLVPVGDPADPHIVTALHFLENGACPVAPINAGAQKLRSLVNGNESAPSGPAWRRAAGVW